MWAWSEMGHRIWLALTCSWWASVGEMGMSGRKLMRNEWGWDADVVRGDGHGIWLVLTCSWWASVGKMGVSGHKLMRNEWGWDADVVRGDGHGIRSALTCSCGGCW